MEQTKKMKIKEKRERERGAFESGIQCKGPRVANEAQTCAVITGHHHRRCKPFTSTIYIYVISAEFIESFLKMSCNSDRAVKNADFFQLTLKKKNYRV